MKKYLAVFKISFSQEFIYRLNFVMWRFRNVLQVFIIFYMWANIFADSGKVLFGYSKEMILTYVFGILIVKALVMSSRSVDVSGDITRGEITNYLLKPVSYLKYWLVRDLSSKALNLVFAVGETLVLALILRPAFYFQTNPLFWLLFLLSLVVAFLIYFNLLFLVSSVPFWYPEISWGAQFLFMAIFAEFLSGSVFPINILPEVYQNILMLTPFPYLIYFPIQIYLGKLSVVLVLKGMAISFVWLGFLYLSMRKVWQRGLIAYSSFGR